MSGIRRVSLVILAVGIGWIAAMVYANLHKASTSPGNATASGGGESGDEFLVRVGGGGKRGSVSRPAPPYKDPMDYPKPLVFFDITIDGQPAGRVKFRLFTKQSPRAAENFRALCTGEKGLVPDEDGREGRGQPLWFKGHEFYRVIDQFICQTGINTESVFGGMFKDDPGGIRLRHDRKGLLSMANMGPDTNTAHFSIMMNPAPHLNGHYTIFGEVVEGFEVVEAINKLAKKPGDVDEKPTKKVVIADCGQLE